MTPRDESALLHVHGPEGATRGERRSAGSLIGRLLGGAFFSGCPVGKAEDIPPRRRAARAAHEARFGKYDPEANPEAAEVWIALEQEQARLREISLEVRPTVSTRIRTRAVRLLAWCGKVLLSVPRLRWSRPVRESDRHGASH